MNDQSKHSHEWKVDFHIDIIRSLLLPLTVLRVDQRLGVINLLPDWNTKMVKLWACIKLFPWLIIPRE